LLEAWQRNHDTPAVALSAHFGARVSLRLQRLKAIVLTKDGIFAEAQEVARLLFGSAVVESLPSKGADTFQSVLERIRAEGWRYAPFVEQLETNAIRSAVEHEGSVRGAAEALGMKRSTLISKLRKIGFSRKSN
jgi:DNA-binding NtrC family response regulator